MSSTRERLELIRKEATLKGLVNSHAALEIFRHVDHIESQLVIADAQIKILLKEIDHLAGKLEEEK